MDPYTVLGLPLNSSDEQIRGRYLELVREFPPEQFPEKSGVIRMAYELLKDLDKRVDRRLFGSGANTLFDGLLEELECSGPRRRVSLAQMVQAVAARY